MSVDRSQGYGQAGEDPLAYGDDRQSSQPEPYEEGSYDGGGDQKGERGIVGDTFRKLRGKPPKKPGESSGLGSFVFGKLHGAVHDIGSEIGKRFDGKDKPGQVHWTTQWPDRPDTTNNHRFGSFASQRVGNDVKWYVDGCSYMWAVSLALERARQSIWILDCTVSAFRVWRTLSSHKFQGGSARNFIFEDRLRKTNSTE